jgi:hypothetical protein
MISKEKKVCGSCSTLCIEIHKFYASVVQAQAYYLHTVQHVTVLYHRESLKRMGH